MRRSVFFRDFIFRGLCELGDPPRHVVQRSGGVEAHVFSGLRGLEDLPRRLGVGLKDRKMVKKSKSTTKKVTKQQRKITRKQLRTKKTTVGEEEAEDEEQEEEKENGQR